MDPHLGPLLRVACSQRVDHEDRSLGFIAAEEESDQRWLQLCERRFDVRIVREA